MRSQYERSHISVSHVWPRPINRWKKERSAAPRGPLNLILIMCAGNLELEELFDVSQRCIQPNDIGAKILAVGTHTLINAARLERVVSAIAIVVVDEAGVIGGLWEQVSSRPDGRGESRRSCNQSIVSEGVGRETPVDAGYRHVVEGATSAASRVPDRIPASHHHIIRKDKSIHRRSGEID